MKDYQQRILSAIADFQMGKRKARRKGGGVFGKNRPFRGGKVGMQQIKNQQVNK
ncbi:MAG TPA: hypothetical protein PLL20_22185 [Phycisphaerae bacterium]|nr:hypothetical protein [Phycisphaerae bacterium]HRS12983.1 hypothetical protein [Sedimentisphaerales bacterium]